MAGEIHVNVNTIQKAEGGTFSVIAKLKNQAKYAGSDVLAPGAYFFQVRFGYRDPVRMWKTRSQADYGPISFAVGETKEIGFECPVQDVRESGGFSFQLIYWMQGGSADNEAGFFEGQEGCITAVLVSEITPDLSWLGGSLT